MNRATELALRTWYPVDHPLHLKPLHPALGLAGEAGELLDLYKKELYKEGVSWWDCVHCGQYKDNHSYTGNYCDNDTGNIYTSKVLGELGDLWYYLRILAYQFDQKLIEVTTVEINDVDIALLGLSITCSSLALGIAETEALDPWQFKIIYSKFIRILELLDLTLDQVTESNWDKLNKPDEHGWANSARKK